MVSTSSGSVLLVCFARCCGQVHAVRHGKSGLPELHRLQVRGPSIDLPTSGPKARRAAQRIVSKAVQSVDLSHASQDASRQPPSSTLEHRGQRWRDA